MRVLTKFELADIAGGYDHKGYTFSYLIEASTTGVVAGAILAIVVFSAERESLPILSLLGGALGGGYAALQMIANALDNKYFPAPVSAPVVDTTVAAVTA